MGIFSGVGTATVHGGGVYFRPGYYRVRVDSAFAKLSENPKSKGDPLFIIETTVIASKRIAEDGAPAPLAPGQRPSQVIKMKETMGPPNAKIFMAAATGLDPKRDGLNQAMRDFWAPVMEESGISVPSDPDNAVDVIGEFIASGAQPLQGIVIDVEATNIKTGQNKDFTKLWWRSAEEDAFGFGPVEQVQE